METQQTGETALVAVIAFEPDETTLQELSSYAQSADLQTRAFDGHDAVTLLIPLIPTAIAAIVKVYNSHLAARRYISIVINGTEIRGVSEKKLLQVISAVERLKDSRRE